MVRRQPGFAESVTYWMGARIGMDVIGTARFFLLGPLFIRGIIFCLPDALLFPGVGLISAAYGEDD